MADVSGLQFPAPTDWPAFERTARSIFAHLLNDPLTQLNGRNGQEQNGIDIFARRADGRYVGIQCKLKDQLANDPTLKLSQFRDEVLAAREQFKPNIGTFILATTAANDAELQEYARVLTEEFKQDELDVQFYGWHQLRSLLGEIPALREQYLGTEGLTAIETKMDDQHAILNEKLSQILSIIPQSQDKTASQIRRSLDRTKGKMERGSVREALEDLLSIKEDEWEDASKENRFVLLTQIGSAYWQLNDRDMAVPFFVDAALILPDNEKGLANVAASLAVTGNPQGARSASLKLLGLYPESEMGLLALIQAQDLIEPLVDPLDAIPASRRACEEAYLGTIQVLRNRDDDRWTSLAEQGLAAHPDSELLERMQADAVLHRIAITDGVHAGARAEDCPTWAEIGKAADTLLRHWKAHISLRPRNIDTELAQNLAQLLRALQRIDEGLEVVEQAGPDRMSDGRKTHVHTTLLVLAKRVPEARIKIAERLDVVANRLLASHICEKPSDAMVLLDDGDWSSATRDEELWRELLRLESRKALHPDADVLPELELLIAKYPERLPPLIALGRQCETQAAVDAAADRIMAAIKPEMPFRDYLLAGEWMHHAHKFRQLADLLLPRISPEIDTPALHWLIDALSELGDRAGLEKFLSSIPGPLASTPTFLNYAAIAAFNAGDIPKARAAVDKLLDAVPTNLTFRMMWVQVLLRQNDRAPIAAWLEGPVEQLEGSAEKRAELGHLLSSFALHERAISFGYRIARENSDNKYAQERFLASCLMHPVAISTPVVAPDCVFTLVDATGESRDYRLETENFPREGIDLLPTAPLARAASGRAVGDTVQLPAQLRGAPAQTFTIKAIRHKHTHYFQLLAETMPTRFAGPVMLHKFSVDPETGAGIEIIHDTLRVSSEDNYAAFEEYRSTLMPLRLLALAVDKDVIDTYDGLVSVPNLPFKAEEGRVSPQVATSIKLNERKGCLVDAITIELIRRHGLFDIVRAVLGPLSITQDTFDLFHMRCEGNRQLAAIKEAGSLTHIDGKTVHLPDVPVLREAAADERVKARDWLLEHSKVVPSVGPDGLALKLAGELHESLHATLLDDILAAAQANIALLSDDLGYRLLAKASAVEIAIGIDGVLRFALEKRAIDHAEYVEKMSRLAAARYASLSISASDLNQALMLDGGELGRVILPLLTLFGGPGCDLSSHLGVAIAFLKDVWSEVSLKHIRLPILLHIADRLLGEQTPERTKLGGAIFRDPDMGVEQLYHHVSAVIAQTAPTR